MKNSEEKTMRKMFGLAKISLLFCFFLSYLLVLLQRVFILVSELQTPKRLKEALVSTPKPNKLGKPMY
jgi:hypothetical protein